MAEVTTEMFPLPHPEALVGRHEEFRAGTPAGLEEMVRGALVEGSRELGGRGKRGRPRASFRRPLLNEIMGAHYYLAIQRGLSGKQAIGEISDLFDVGRSMIFKALMGRTRD